MQAHRAPTRCVQTVLVGAWLIHQWMSSQREEQDVSPVLLTIRSPILPEVLKFAIAVVCYFWQRRGGTRRATPRHATRYEENLPLSGVNGDGQHELHWDDEGKHAQQHATGTRIPPSVACAFAVLAAVLSTVYTHNVRVLVNGRLVNIERMLACLL